MRSSSPPRASRETACRWSSVNTPCHWSTRGLSDYQEAYLAEVAPLLDERQYHALANFESTEFTVELERLQQIINTR